MWKRLWNDDTMARKFIRGGLDDVDSKVDIRWDGSKVESYLRHIKRFKEELFALYHLTVGAPTRRTKILSI